LTGSIITARYEAALSHLAAGRLGEADRLFRAVLAEAPTHAPAAKGLGDLAFMSGQAEAAAACYRAAISFDPAHSGARVSLGMVLRGQGFEAEAQEVFAQAAADDPTCAAAFYWLGFSRLEHGDIDGAVASLDRAASLEPGLVGPLGASLYGYFERCEWGDWPNLVRFMETAAASAKRALFSPMNLMLVSDSAEAIAKESRKYAADHCRARTPLCSGPHPRGRKIRLAYLTSDFRNHPVAHVIAGVLEHHDRNAFELTAMSFGAPDSSQVRRRIEASFDAVCEVEAMSDEAIAGLIRERQIDIAICLKGYTGECRTDILARKPAPLQVGYLGYPGTYGAPYMDYLIADRHVIPADQTRFYDEKIVWMPDSYHPTDDKAEISSATPGRAQQGLPDGAVVLMAYNRTQKITPRIFAAWMRILARAPAAVLWLQDAGPEARDNLRREAQGRGVDPARLIFARGEAALADHIARHRLADLFIDTLPYNAHATAINALWAGVPVVTCRGTTFPGRVGAGLLTAAGLPELICETVTDYEDLIAQLANDRSRLAVLRARTEAQAPKSALFQTANYTRHLEAAFKTMYERQQAGLSPDHISIEAI